MTACRTSPERKWWEQEASELLFHPRPAFAICSSTASWQSTTASSRTRWRAKCYDIRAKGRRSEERLDLGASTNNIG